MIRIGKTFSLLFLFVIVPFYFFFSLAARPIYNKAQAEQAAYEIVSAFLRGQLTVPGLEALSMLLPSPAAGLVTSSSSTGLSSSPLLPLKTEGTFFNHRKAIKVVLT